MDDRTKNFLNDLNDLLEKYDIMIVIEAFEGKFDIDLYDSNGDNSYAFPVAEDRRVVEIAPYFLSNLLK